MGREMVLSFLVTSFFATASCLFLRWRHDARYARLTVFWLMSVFAFTFANEIFVFPLLGMPKALSLASLAAVAPFIADVFFPDERPEVPEPAWERVVFGGMVLLASCVTSFNSALAIEKYMHLSEEAAPLGGVAIATITASIAIGSAGTLIVLLPHLRKRVRNAF